MRVGIVQSSYIPWRGAFALIALCDTFIFLDSVQFTRRDWRSRNRIKTPHGPSWLTVPVRQRGNRLAAIDTIEVADSDWAERHLARIAHGYRRAPHFPSLYPCVREAYASVSSEPLLATVNRRLTAAACAAMGVRTTLRRDSDVLDRSALIGADPTDRLIALCAAVGAKTYVSGPSARAYLDVDRFAASGMEVAWMDYAGLAAHPQLWGAFTPNLSILDSLFNLGCEGARASLDGCRAEADGDRVRR